VKSPAAAAPKAADKAAAGDGATADGVTAEKVAAPTADAENAEPVIRKVNSAPVEPVRIVSAFGPMLLKRLSPIAILGVIAVWLRHRHKSNA
jgi:hypothetical protein